VVLNDTRVYFYSEPAACAAFVTKIPGAWAKLGFNDSVRVYPDRHEADLVGEHSFRRPIIDMVINETGARRARGGPLRARPQMQAAGDGGGGWRSAQLVARLRELTGVRMRGRAVRVCRARRALCVSDTCMV
jgi:hypothetical protein